MDVSIQNLIVQTANSQGVDPNLAVAVANQESGGDQNARGAAGEVGVFQLLPSSFPGVNIADLQTNIQTGVSYLRNLLSEFGGDAQKALAAYNWGPPRVAAVVAQYGANWFQNIPGQVRGYVSAVLAGGGFVGSIVGTFSSLLPPLSAPNVSTQPEQAASTSWLWIALLGTGAAYFLFSD